MLAEVLTASTYPLDVVAAAQWLDAGNNPANVGSQPWDDSIKGLVNFPDILHYMASNVDWMNSLGDAFINQSADVMTAVQDLRAEALFNGSLLSDANQQVVQNGNIIQIIPANPDTIYIPIYDPAVIYVRRTPLRFDHGYRVGPWLDHDLDWVDHRIYTGNWGANRPWWHPEVRGGHPTLDYTRIRPGDFHATGAIRSNAWQRDEHRPAPVFPARARFVPRTGVPEPDIRQPPVRGMRRLERKSMRLCVLKNMCLRILKNMRLRILKNMCPRILKNMRRASCAGRTRARARCSSAACCSRSPVRSRRAARCERSG